MLADERLFAEDFDGTSHLTSEPAPNGMTVPLAYEYAVERVYGSAALKQYLEEGGLRNRAPFELAQQLIPQADIDTKRQKTEDVIQAKLETLLDQVGSRTGDSFWPRLNPGFKRLWTPASAEPSITTGTVSSGHQEFIRKSFEVHELAPPDLFVTDDDMRPLLAHIGPELCVKPSRLLLDMLHYQWVLRCGAVAADIDDPDFMEATRERILYIGDDYQKDRALAKNAGVKFVHVEAGRSEAAFSHVARKLELEAAL